MTLLSILDRFRPAGAPGHVGVVGVPALDDTGSASELAPIFAALEPDVAACAEQVAAARSAARASIHAAHESAATLLAEARLRADAARAEAESAVHDEATAGDAALLTDAREEVARVEVLGQGRAAALAPRLAEAIVDPRTGSWP
ncbi:MAG: hypothetical protein CVT68_12150 [Actinobacteria bacterium HGW-Actinobacteria-8]|nr:MAG: hypothetical protein CVT68_12150 [Actinobacteria bacterium HGW-Actinobacteria-8]